LLFAVATEMAAEAVGAVGAVDETEPSAKEETYTVLTTLEHLHRRPESYMGSIDIENGDVWELAATAEGHRAQRVSLQGLSHALQHLVLELITNALDHAARPGTGVTAIDITVTADAVAVANNGRGISAKPHAQFPSESQVTTIFSNFRCGSNFDDTVQRCGAGRNGYGAKLANAYAAQFTVETWCEGTGFCQTWRNKMAQAEAPIIGPSAHADGTRITFVPAYEDLLIHTAEQRASNARAIASMVWHLAAVAPPQVTITLNGAPVPIRSFREYAKAMSPDGAVAFDATAALQVAVIAPVDGFSGSFVNGIPCAGGSHVTYVTRQILAAVNSDPRKSPITDAALRRACTILVAVVLPNPKFKSQLKQSLAGAPGLAWLPSDAFRRSLASKGGVAERARLAAQMQDLSRAQKDVRKLGRGVANIEKLQDAGFAGQGKRRAPCTLILPEGDSACALAVSGLGVVPGGRDRFGIFTLRGKPPNAFSSPQKALENTEVRGLLAALGIDPTSPPESTSKLRYDHLLIMTDQDPDGHHIAALVITIIAAFAPALLSSHADFIQRFGTALIKATTTTAPKQAVQFTTEASFVKWWGMLREPERAKYHVKYYKGLGTSTPLEAKEYFSNFERHCVAIDCTDAAHRERLREMLSEGAEFAANRRQLLDTVCAGAYEIDYTKPSVALERFLNGDLLDYWRSNNGRSIPHAVDGLKDVNRQILWTLFNLPRGTEMKVAQLQGVVAKETEYPHGEDSIGKAACNMAAMHSNNLSLLKPEGNFGDRHGRAHGSTRYLYTGLEKVAYALFPVDDADVLTRVMAEGRAVQPEIMPCVIALVLCNGAAGIGTGVSTDVPACDPTEVLRWTRGHIEQRRRALLEAADVGGSSDDDDGSSSDSSSGMQPPSAMAAAQDPPPELPQPMIPMFGGPRTMIGHNKWEFAGVLGQPDPCTVHVTDLPMPTQQFLATARKKAAFRETDRSTDNTVDVMLTFAEPVTPEQLSKLQRAATLTVNTTNMTLWTGIGNIKRLHKFPTIESILRYHAEVRIYYYTLRKDRKLQDLRHELLRIRNKQRFISAIMADAALLHNRSRDSVLAWLAAERYDLSNDTYDYLLRMQMQSATSEMLERLRAEDEATVRSIATLQAQTELDLWSADLTVLEAALAEFYALRQERRATPAASHATPAAAASTARKRKRPATVRKTDQ